MIIKIYDAKLMSCNGIREFLKHRDFYRGYRFNPLFSWVETFADQTRDWFTIKGIIVGQEGQLNIEYVFKHLTQLSYLKESP